MNKDDETEKKPILTLLYQKRNFVRFYISAMMKTILMIIKHRFVPVSFRKLTERLFKIIKIIKRKKLY